MDYDFTYTGAEIQAILDTAKKLKDSGYIFLGVATPSTNPGTPTQKVYYEAKQAGTYTNFGGVVLPDGISLLIWNGSWTSETVMCGDGGVFDISVYKSSGGTLATFADLAAALDGGNNIPASARKGGMSVKFVQSSDNKYVQYRYMGTDITGNPNPFLDTANWQGVDDKPTAGSKNLVESGGVENKVGNVITKNGQFSVVDENGYIGANVDNEGVLKIKDIILPVNGNLVPLSNLMEGLQASDGLYICDDDGYILFGVKPNGDLIKTIGSDSCVTINFAGKNYNVSNGIIIIPKNDVQIPYSGKLELPSKINILQGNNVSLYYEQMLGAGFLRDYMISEIKYPYKPQGDRMLINTSTAGEIECTMNLFNTFGTTIEQKDIVVNVVNKTASGSFKVCVIGDSMTANPKKLLELANLAANDSYLSISFLGAITATGTDSEGNTRTIKHCGYSGRSIVDVCQLASYGTGLPNIFYDSNIQTTNKFSIAKGIEAMGDTPDVIFIDHGANQASKAWSEVKGCYDFIIDDIKAYNIANNTDIKVVVCVQQPGGLSEIMAGSSVPSKWGRNWSPTKLMDYVREYDNKEDDGIYLLPQYLIIDPYKDYPRADVPYSTRNTSLREVSLDNTHPGINMNGYDSNHTYSYGETCTDGNQNGYISLKNNNTEPLSDDKIHWAKTKDDVNAGYWKLADAYFAELKYIASL